MSVRSRFAIASIFALSSFIFFEPFISKVYAITAPDGGSSFDTAEPLTEGEYSTTPIPESTDFYYSIKVPAGYELKINYQFIENTYYGSTTLYSFNREELVTDDHKGGTLRWLNGNNTKQETDYYLVLSNWNERDGFSLNIELIERFEAKSGKDAGDTFTNAVPLDYGEHEGHISYFIYGSEGGNDEIDFYKLAVNKGDTITFRVTPEGLSTVGLALYDENRGEVYNNDGLDLSLGEIVQTSIDISRDGYIYVAVKWPDFNHGNDNIVKYTLIATKSSIDKPGGITGGTGETDDDIETLINASDANKTSLNAWGGRTKILLIAGFSCVLLILLIVGIILVVKMMSKKPVKKSEEKSDKNNTSASVSNQVNPTLEADTPANTASEDSMRDGDNEKAKTETINGATSVPASNVNGAQTQSGLDVNQKVSVTVPEGTQVEVNTVPDKENGQDR